MVDQGVGDVRCSGCNKSNTKEPPSGTGTTTTTLLSKFLSMVSDDVLLEIFLRLPDARTAIRFGSVCKRWNDLILRNPKFIQKFIHIHHHRQLIAHSLPPRPYTIFFERSYFWFKLMCYYDSQLSQLVSEESSTLYETPSPGYENILSHPWHITGICNDLLLLVTGEERNFYICNPITRKWLKLPCHPSGFTIAGTGLVCQPCSSDAIDTSQYRYKVVLMSPKNDRVMIFSSDTGRWIKYPVSFPGKLESTYGWHSVSCNGVVYWLDGRGKFKGIAAFDPFKDVGAQGRCRFVALPMPLGDRYWRANGDRTCFGACQNKLRFSLWLRRSKGCFAVKIWELDAIASWQLVHQLVLKRADTNKMDVLAFHPKDGDVIFVLCDDQLCRYEIGKKIFQELGQWPFNLTVHRWEPQAPAYTLEHPLWPSPIPALPSA